MDANIEIRKLNLISFITKLRDERTLAQTENLVTGNLTDRWDNVSEAEKDAIPEAKESLKNGEGISHEIVMTETQERYLNLF